MFDYPIFDVPWLGVRMLFALDAIPHVFISHGAAVGGSVIVSLLVWLAIKRNDQRLDDLAYKIMFPLFIIATAVGALSGIGIWIHVNMINPAGIGALLRVFFWKWFVEWIVFNIEMIFLLWFFLTWKNHKIGTPGKAKHFKLMLTYSIASWFTLLIIAAILGFMMTPGNWMVSYFPPKPDYLASLMNPSWIPSVGFRTGFAIAWAGAVCMLIGWFYTKNDPDLRQTVMKVCGTTVLVATPFWLGFGYWYYEQFPQAAKDIFWMGAITRRLAAHPEYAMYMTATFAAMLMGGFAMVYFKPKKAPLAAAIVMVIGAAALIGEFERVREFVRKPYIIYGYMYANGIRVADMPYMKKDGYLKHATFVPTQFKTITEENKEVVGKYLFKMECRFCHTENGINSVKARLENLGIQGNEEAIYARLGSLNSPATPYMPPFAGNDTERHALASYLKSLHEPATEGIAADFRGSEEIRR